MLLNHDPETSHANGTTNDPLPLPALLPLLLRQVYNKNGRIGIYTPAERSAIIAKFHGKRSRRVWNKKIRYGCRKDLADRRMRVKGRFVKRSTEQAAQLRKRLDRQAEEAKATTVPSSGGDANPGEGFDPQSATSFAEEGSEAKDEDMPDVNLDDGEAGFDPTDNQPYRRTRRYTIT